MNIETTVIGALLDIKEQLNRIEGMTEIERQLNAKNTRLIAAATIMAALIQRTSGYFGPGEREKLAQEAVKLFVCLDNAFEEQPN